MHQNTSTKKKSDPGSYSGGKSSAEESIKDRLLLKFYLTTLKKFEFTKNKSKQF